MALLIGDGPTINPEVTSLLHMAGIPEEHMRRPETIQRKEPRVVKGFPPFPPRFPARTRNTNDAEPAHETENRHNGSDKEVIVTETEESMDEIPALLNTLKKVSGRPDMEAKAYALSS